MSDYRDDYDDYELSESATIHEKLYFAIEKRRWGELRRLIREGAKEDLGHYDYKDYPLMFDIIAAGASDTACYWLDRGYPVNARGGRAGITLAHAAAAHDQPDVLLKLIEKGSEINAEDNEGHTPLWEASMYGNIRCARILLDAGVNPDGFEEASEGDEYPAHNTPLSVAKYENIVRLLLGRGASLGINCYSSYIDNPGLGDDDYVSPLSLAAHEGRGGTVEALLEAGADPEFCDGQPLRLLAGSDKYSKWIMRELLKAGAKVAGQSGLESLKAASAAGNLEALRDLLEAGAAPAPEALTIAAKKGKFACAAYLLKKNIGDPLAAIRAAAKAGNEDILFYILGRTPEKGCLGAALHGAIEGARFPLIRELMALGAKPDCRDERGLTPLAKLYELDRRRAIFSCLRHSPEEYAGKWSNGFGRRDLPDDDEPELWRFNMRRPNNWNDLVAKFEDDVMALARELIDKGADPFAKDRLGRSVFWHVCNKCWLKSIPWFAEMGAKLEERDRDEVSVFEAGCLCMDSWVLNPMLKLGYDINARDANGDTVLLKLARTNGERNNHCVVIMRLLEAGADPKLENAKGESYAKMAETDKNLAYALEWAERYRERDKK